jgi:hypothetical protein
MISQTIEPYNELEIETLIEADESLFVRGVMDMAHIENFFQFQSFETMDRTGLESILEFEYDEAVMFNEDLSFESFVNEWLDKKNLAYNYNDATKTFTACGVNAGSLSDVFYGTGCPCAGYLILFKGRWLSENLGQDGSVVKPLKIVKLYKL